MALKLKSPDVDIFVPDGTCLDGAFEKTTRLAITAHQDDTEIAAIHGVMECFGRADEWFAGVTVTNGSGSPRSGRYGHLSDEEMMEVRLREQRKAAMVGEYAFHVQLGYSSSTVKDSSESGPFEDILSILRASRPEIVYIHNPADKHVTHVATALRSIEALRSLPEDVRPGKVFGCEVWRGLDWLQDDEKEFLGVDAGSGVAASLIGLFDSQVAGGKRYDLASSGRRLANATFFASHDTDDAGEAVYAMDLTPLVADPSLSVVDFVLAAIDRFKKDVSATIGSVS